MTSQVLPPEPRTAVVESGLYVIRFAPYPAKRYVSRLALLGPSGSTVNTYISETFNDTTPRGDYNSAEYAPEQVVIPRNAVYKLQWSVGTGTPTPTATLYTVTF